MRTDWQTSKHLLLAAIVTVYSVMLIMMTIIMGWELWMIPMIAVGMFSVWFFHIGRSGSEIMYENLCAGVMLGEFFFFGIHKGILFDIPAVACIMILIFSMFDRKRLLYLTVALYVLEILYHVIILQSLAVKQEDRIIMRLIFGAVVVAGAESIARYRINKRLETKKMHDDTFAQLETAGKQNAVFLSNVSHELRTPINTVIGISEVLKERDISPEVREDVASIQMAGRRLSSLINNMLDYTEIVEGTLSPVKEEYRFTSVLNDVLTVAAMQNSISQLEIVFDVDPKLPSVLIGDAEKISHVLKSLVENSIKFTEEGGIDICVGFRRESYGVNLLIDISDTGIGMTDSQLAQICDDFYQADSGSSRLTGGLGLGLPIARGLLHAMGGFIYFDSKGNEGIQAYITIPQGVADDTPCMEINNVSQFCIACYFRPEKYSCDDVRSYYDRLIMHMMEGLDIKGYQAHNFEGLQKLLRTYKLTHVFIAQTEYEENRSYYEELADKLCVVVIAEMGYILEKGSRLLIIRKPFSALSVVNLLNGEIRENKVKEAQVAGRRPFSCEGVRVLAVDDEEMNLMVAKGLLGGYGIQVDTCLDGREAIEKCQRISYDIIFLDHMMPEFDGVQTLKRIREMNDGIYRERPVIALTANTISGAREMFRNEGFTEFIPKPIERATLERVLRKVLPEQCVHYNAAPLKEETVVNAEPVKEPAEAVTLHKPERKPAKAAGAAIKVPSKEQAGSDAGEGIRKTPQKSTGSFVKIKKAETDVRTGVRKPSGSVVKDKEEPIPRSSAAHKAEGYTDSPAPYEEGWKEAEVTEAESKEEDMGHGVSQEEDTAAKDTSASYARLKRIGINVKRGLDYCCGDEDFYMEMLQMFRSQSADKKAEIAALYEASNWEDYAVKVHALKSTSLTIGAERLSAHAKLLEHAGKNKDVRYIRKNHKDFLRMYEEVCESIAEL